MPDHDPEVAAPLCPAAVTGSMEKTAKRNGVKRWAVE